MTVTELLRLAPFSLGTITILLAAGGLIFGHAYGRYGDDAAISFLLRWRFVAAGAVVFPTPVLMLVSFGRGEVPAWLTERVAAVLVAAGIAATMLVVGYLLLSVSRPGMFLATVGKRVTTRRLNRYALAVRWRQANEFGFDVAGRRYRWFGAEIPGLRGDAAKPGRLRRVRWSVVERWMKVRRLALRGFRTDPSEMLFDAAAAGLKNGNMRTWRSALDVIGRRLTTGSLDAAAVGHLVANAQALEESAHRQGSEDCKVRLCSALGVVGGVPMSDDAAEALAKGISSLAERRLGEHRPVMAAIDALRATAAANGIPAVKTIGWLGQHLAAVPPPAVVYGFDGDRIEHPTRALFALLVELAGRADHDDDARLNDAIIDAGSMIVRRLPGSQDRETIETLGFALGRAGIAAGRRYGKGEDWHGTHDAVAALVRVHEVLHEANSGAEPSPSDWIAEELARMGCWVIPNTRSLGFHIGSGLSDMAALVAQRLLELPHDSIARAFVELQVRQHNSDIPQGNRDAFIARCQRMSGELLGMGVFLEAPDDSDDGA
ncbi:hypothetical protein GKE82_11370 [Conexibacter sp. W3-3-2]|uniref:hypothetical protein n=1 Tax=Conexibacter sp. W3-3-2 TaxID=2675227 RepID=UPI0012B7A0EC|nr:hypothetical protein [Conexibacter sp. W3-3-2]MTD44874.1 hypothetical protein [Conexibacter sp. W3-3-2]